MMAWSSSMLFTLKAPRAYLPLSALANRSVVCVSGIVLGAGRGKFRDSARMLGVRGQKGIKNFRCAGPVRRSAELQLRALPSRVAVFTHTRSWSFALRIIPRLPSPLGLSKVCAHFLKQNQTELCRIPGLEKETLTPARKCVERLRATLEEGRRHHRRRRRHRHQRQVHRERRRRSHHHLQLRPLPHDGPRLDRRHDGLRRRQRHRDGDRRIRSAARRGRSAP